MTLVNVKPEGKQAIVAGGEVDAAFDLYTSYAIWEKVLGKGQVGHLLWATSGCRSTAIATSSTTSWVKKNPKLIERSCAPPTRAGATPSPTRRCDRCDG